MAHAHEHKGQTSFSAAARKPHKQTTPTCSTYIITYVDTHLTSFSAHACAISPNFKHCTRLSHTTHADFTTAGPSSLFPGVSAPTATTRAPVLHECKTGDSLGVVVMIISQSHILSVSVTIVTVFHLPCLCVYVCMYVCVQMHTYVHAPWI